MKKTLAALALVTSALLSSAPTHALELTESDIQSFLKAAPALEQWAQSETSLDTASLLGAVQSDSSASSESMVSSAVAMLKENDYYNEVADLVGQYGFTPEQIITVGSEISNAYFANLKGDLSEENQATVNSVLGNFGGSTGNSQADSLLNGLKKANEAEVSENNLSLVQEYMPQIKSLLSSLNQ